MSSLYAWGYWIPTTAIYARDRKNQSYHLLLVLHWVLSSTVDALETCHAFKIKIHVHTTIYMLLLHWKYAKTCFPFRHIPKNCCTPTLGESNQKYHCYVFIQWMLQVLAIISHIYSVVKEACGYAKINKEKVRKKWTSVQLKKRRKRKR